MREAATGARAESDRWNWIGLAAGWSACAIWGSFARTDQLVAWVARWASKGEGATGFVWAGGVVAVVVIMATGILVRNHRIDGYSMLSWLYLTLSLGLVLAALILVREARGRAVTLDMWIVFAGSAAAFVQGFWRKRRSTNSKAS